MNVTLEVSGAWTACAGSSEQSIQHTCVMTFTTSVSSDSSELLFHPIGAMERFDPSVIREALVFFDSFLGSSVSHRLPDAAVAVSCGTFPCFRRCEGNESFAAFPEQGTPRIGLGGALRTPRSLASLCSVLTILPVSVLAGTREALTFATFSSPSPFVGPRALWPDRREVVLCVGACRPSRFPGRGCLLLTIQTTGPG